MTESEAKERLEYLKNKAEVALITTESKCFWLKDDVKGTIISLDVAINALEKMDKIKEVFTHYPFMGIEISVLNDCVSALSEIKTILKE